MTENVSNRCVICISLVDFHCEYNGLIFDVSSGSINNDFRSIPVVRTTVNTLWAMTLICHFTDSSWAWELEQHASQCISMPKGVHLYLDQCSEHKRLDNRYRRNLPSGYVSIPDKMIRWSILYPDLPTTRHCDQSNGSNDSILYRRSTQAMHFGWGGGGTDWDSLQCASLGGVIASN